MSTNGLPVFDHTLQLTHIWLDEISAEIGPDRALAWKVLSAVLQTLRDRLPLGLAAHLGAQLPILVRGIYYEEFDPESVAPDIHGAYEFVQRVEEGLDDTRTVDPKDAIIAVFNVLMRHLSEGQMAKVRRSLPKDIRKLLPE